MRVAVLAAGSREDVLPLVALGEGLTAAGHRVTLGATPALAGLAHSRGLTFAPLESGAHVLDGQREATEPLVDRALEEAWVACEDTEAVIWTPGCPQGRHVAEAMQVPASMAALEPVTPAGEFATPPLPELPLPGLLRRTYNRAGSEVLTEVSAVQRRHVVNRWRDLLGIRPQAGPGLLGGPARHAPSVIYGFSERVVPRPAAWGPGVAITGYWPLGLSEEAQTPPGLERFLAAGSAPVGILLSGLPAALAARAAETVLEALSYTAERAVLVGGAEVVGSLPAGLLKAVFPVADVSPRWLLPQLGAFVHAGTAWLTAEALAAGVPSVLLPSTSAQAFWSRRVSVMLASPPPIPARRMSPAQLVRALDLALNNQRIRSHALVASRLLGDEDGIGNGVRAFEEAVARHTGRAADSAPDGQGWPAQLGG